jgi:hypothetical protein
LLTVPGVFVLPAEQEKEESWHHFSDVNSTMTSAY